MATTLVILYVNIQGYSIRQDQISCTSEQQITADQALNDLNSGEQENLMYCYCRSILWSKLAESENPYPALSELFSDG